MNTRSFVLLLMLWRWAMPSGVAATFDDIQRKAEVLAQKPSYNLLDLTWSEHDAIRSKPDKALWRNEGLPFQVELFGSSGKSVGFFTGAS